ncbi:hypothetical protein GSI_10122 [Ganoderma sinense ZZ0214-1]|uniref:Peptidase C14 caspase domain-containing protein n=1 Tax=Ganoderma sinense ZZ0214-1 TaxID=1077348 RepID=A0A2G8RZR8_9APHY|nr:hypothetical protein GSI_10122 [Ganoderma sinense ZZ0214-1]
MYAGYPQQASRAWSPSTPIRSPVSPGFGPGGSDAGYAYPWPSPVHTPPSFATMVPSPDRMSVGTASDYGVPYVPSVHSSVRLSPPVSPSRYGRDPFLVRPEDVRYGGGLGRGRSLSYSSASSRAGHAFARRRSSYEVPPVMNPSVAFSDSIAAQWRGGRKKALCIGVSYFGDRRSELRGSADNARAVQHFLLRHGYRKDDVRILAEDDYDPRRHPTKVNIIDALHWLVKGAQPGDQLFFHYSGHVAAIRGSSRDEVDGYDVIYPVDHRLNGWIVDDLINTILVKKLPRGCRLTALFDAYHSGTALDHNPYQSYRELLRSVGSIIGRRYNCKPKLATSHQIDMASRVVF